ncbi:hypothetical protein HF325_000354 [Metschnikowia pulcherrima]|uniref:Uncharacterized protein n=1 Tax=Metschnikowia pulcherrima TaxID=27326 RepID=A0A8H7GY59_9ASCO|nr:hypothetical protein HF325_000354 [Metschnikowia pulcherrima]
MDDSSLVALTVALDDVADDPPLRSVVEWLFCAEVGLSEMITADSVAERNRLDSLLELGRLTLEAVGLEKISGVNSSGALVLEDGSEGVVMRVSDSDTDSFVLKLNDEAT